MQLLVRPQDGAQTEIKEFQFLSFQNLKLKAGETVEGDTEIVPGIRDPFKNTPVE